MNEIDFLKLILGFIKEQNQHNNLLLSKEMTEMGQAATLKSVEIMLKDRIQEHLDAEKGFDNFIENPTGKN